LVIGPFLFSVQAIITQTWAKPDLASRVGKRTSLLSWLMHQEELEQNNRLDEKKEG